MQGLQGYTNLVKISDLSKNFSIRSGVSRCLLEYIFIPFFRLRAGDAGRCRTDVRACAPGWPWLLGVLQAGRLVRELSPAFALTWMREPPASLPVTKGAERSGAWPRRRSCVWGLAGFGGARAGRPRAPRPRQRPATWVGRRPPRPGPERPKGVSAALTVERGITVFANRH